MARSEHSWVSKHKGTRDLNSPYFKMVHVNLVKAELLKLTLEINKPGFDYAVYECTWTDDKKAGRIGPVHYHVGKKRQCK